LREGIAELGPFDGGIRPVARFGRAFKIPGERNLGLPIFLIGSAPDKVDTLVTLPDHRQVECPDKLPIDGLAGEVRKARCAEIFDAEPFGYADLSESLQVLDRERGLGSNPLLRGGNCGFPLARLTEELDVRDDEPAPHHSHHRLLTLRDVRDLLQTLFMAASHLRASCAALGPMATPVCSRAA
jgi:hypothetical protein